MGNVQESQSCTGKLMKKWEKKRRKCKSNHKIYPRFIELHKGLNFNGYVYLQDGHLEYFSYQFSVFLKMGPSISKAPCLGTLLLSLRGLWRREVIRTEVHRHLVLLIIQYLSNPPYDMYGTYERAEIVTGEYVFSQNGNIIIIIESSSCSDCVLWSSSNTGRSFKASWQNLQATSGMQETTM